MHLLLVFSLLLQPAAPALKLHKQKLPILPIRQFTDDMRDKNLDDVLTLYTSNAVFTDPTGKTFSTPEALHALYVQVFATYDSDLTFTLKDLTAKGDINEAGSTAVETDDYQEELRTRATNKVQNYCGSVVSNWVRTNDDRWQMASQKWTESSCPVVKASN